MSVMVKRQRAMTINLLKTKRRRTIDLRRAAELVVRRLQPRLVPHAITRTAVVQQVWL